MFEKIKIFNLIFFMYNYIMINVTLYYDNVTFYVLFYALKKRGKIS